MRQHKHDYDAFISHAVEDKIPIANELCARLEQAGLRIWYSGKELGIGDSIEKTIANGLHRSRYGIVILSPTYLAKNWTIREFYTLLAKEIEEQKVILPVLYNITLDELKKKDLLMADRFAVNADRGMDYVVDRLVREIRKPQREKARVAWFSRIWVVLTLSLVANVALLLRDVIPARGTSLSVTEDQWHGQGMNAGLLNQMQGIFEHLNACDCDHARHARRPAPRYVKAGMGGGVSLFDDEEVVAVRQKPRKMTMAVVFQIETPSETASGDAVDEMINVTDHADNPTFATVSNQDQADEWDPHTCFRGMARKSVVSLREQE